MDAAGTRYELRVGTLVSRAAVATFRVPVERAAVPRNTVFRFRVPADCDLSELLHRLIERNVQVLEIRRCPEPRGRPAAAPAPQEAPRHEAEEAPAGGAGVVVPFPAPARHRRRRSGPAPGEDSAG